MMTTETPLSTAVTYAPYAPERFAAFAAARAEPEWLAAGRAEAYEALRRLPLPVQQERAWKYYDPTRLRLKDASPAEAEVTFTGAPGEGVTVLPLAQAAAERPELVQRALGSVIKANESAFTALNSAFWAGGLLVHVAKDVRAAEPLHMVVHQGAAGSAILPRLLVVLERGASLTLVEERAGDGTAPSVCAGVTEFVLGDGAALQHFAVQRWGRGVQDISVQRATLGRDAKLTTLVAGLGGEAQKWWVDSRMEGAGSESVMLGVFFGVGAQHFDVITLQDHIGPNTTSDLLYKAALKDRSVGAYYGLTRVGPNARGTAANQEDRNLLLSPKAKADADPVLEIMTSDVVRCGHGASAGPVDPEQLFYLECRGLPRPEAEKLLITGFLHQVTERIPLESVRDTIELMVAAKLEGRI